MDNQPVLPDTPASKGKIVLHILLFLIVFAAGGATGAVVVLTVKGPGQAPRDDRPTIREIREKPGQFEENLAAHIAQRYTLPPESQQKIQEILHANSEKLRALQKDFFPRMQACWDEINNKIRELIPPERREEYDREVQMQRKRIFSPEGGRSRHDGQPRERNSEWRPAPPPAGKAPERQPEAPAPVGGSATPAR